MKRRLVVAAWIIGVIAVVLALGWMAGAATYGN